MVSVVAGATCYDHLIIDTRGTGELQGTSIGFAAIIDQVKESVPNVGVHDTIYPAAPDVTQLTTLVGAYDIEQTIQQGLEDCPKQLYSLLGYSQGKLNCPKSPEKHSILTKAQVPRSPKRSCKSTSPQASRGRSSKLSF